jgi:hypothetical protein
MCHLQQVVVTACGYSNRTSGFWRPAIVVARHGGLQCKSLQALVTPFWSCLLAAQEPASSTTRLGPGSTDEQLAVEVVQEGGVMYVYGVYGQLRLSARRHWNDLRLAARRCLTSRVSWLGLQVTSI